MKTLALLFSVLIGLTACATHDSVSESKQENKKVQPIVDSQFSIFLVEMADARRMDEEEGKLAAARGTKKQIREYGKEMMREQPELRQDIEKIASHYEITLPAQLSVEKNSALADLKKLSGNRFNKKFISMIQIDHERDVIEFKKIQAKAGESAAEKEIKNFVDQELPRIERHLREIKVIAKKN